MARSILFIRHGQSRHNAEGNVFSGISDVQMDYTGRAQCRQTRTFFFRHPVDSVFTSPLKRARESASLIFPDHGNLMTVLDWLIEFNYGDYEGKSLDVKPDDPVIHQWKTEPADLTFPGGDSIRQHAERTHVAFLAFTRGLPDNARVACVTHRTTIRLLVAQVLGLDLNCFRNVPCSNCSVMDIRLASDGKPYIYALNVGLEYTGNWLTGEQ